ncbi:MAG: hypothetical protein LQ347_000856 [Umbilicaria vellea]|nr:MAG: hypothetical protein LQ347_000856 [Umbilicaria vellea]
MESLPDDIVRILFHTCRELDKPTPTLDWGRPRPPKVRGVASTLRLLSKRFKDVVDDIMWRTVRIRSTAASMYGLHWLITSNPRLCERIQAIEYHLTPCAKTRRAPQFADPLRFLENRAVFDRDTFEMDIGQAIPPWARSRERYQQYRRLQNPEIIRTETRRSISSLQIGNNYKHAEDTFYNDHMDFDYLVGVALASRSLPNLRKITVSSFPDEDFPFWWHVVLQKAAKRGAVNDALAGVSADQVFEKPEADSIVGKALIQPAIRAFYVILYGLWRRNTQNTAVAPVSDLTFGWLPPALDRLPNYWQYWTPAALRPITSFSCLNISNDLSMAWVYGYFRFHILRPMTETVEVLKLGYSRWRYEKPRWIHRQEDYYNPGPNHRRRWDNNYNQKAGSISMNVLPLLGLLMPFTRPELELDYRRDWDPGYLPGSRAERDRGRALVSQVENLVRLLSGKLADPKPAELANEPREESYLPRLRELHLKPWLSVADTESFSNLFCLFLHRWNEEKARVLETQDTFRRVHLEGLNLPMGLTAVLDPSTGLMVNSWRRPTWEEVISRIETAPLRDGNRAPNLTVTHDTLWQDTTDPQRRWRWISSPGGGRIIAWDPAHTDQVFIKPWGECWSWMGDEAKQNWYMKRVANHLPFDLAYVTITRVPTMNYKS